MAIQEELILDRRSNGHRIISAAGVYIRRAVSKQVITPRNKRPNFPSNPAVNSHVNQHRPRQLIMVQRLRQVRRHWHGGAVQERRPHRDVLMALVGGLQPYRRSDLLAVVGGVDVETVVVNADSAVRVAGGEGDLEGGGEEVWGGEVEGVDGGVLEHEMRLRGAEDQPHQEDCEEDGDDEGGDAEEDVPIELFPAVAVVATVLHCCGGGGGGGGSLCVVLVRVGVLGRSTVLYVELGGCRIKFIY